MAEVRAAPGIPLVGAFAGLGAPSPCAPIVVNSTTGEAYTLKDGDVVVQIYNGSAENSVIESRTFVPQPMFQLVGNSQGVLEGRAFVSQPMAQLIGNSQSVLESRAFAMPASSVLYQTESMPILASQIFGG